jgi:hypothetical protein
VEKLKNLSFRAKRGISLRFKHQEKTKEGFLASLGMTKRAFFPQFVQPLQPVQSVQSFSLSVCSIACWNAAALTPGIGEKNTAN